MVLFKIREKMSRIAIALLVMLLPFASAYAMQTGDSDSEKIGATGVSEPNSGGFTWGVDVSSAIDVTANNMTYTGLDAFFGYKSKYIRVIGVGAGINMMMSNASASFPIYAILQTNFQDKPTVCFLSLKGGISVNRIYNYTRQTGGYAQLGIGFNLARGKSFRSHILLGYTVIMRKDFEWDDGIYRCPALQFVTFGIGVAF